MIGFLCRGVVMGLGLCLAWMPPARAEQLQFTSPLVLATGAELPDLEADGSGSAHLIYQRADGVHYRRLSGGSWGSDHLVPQSSGASETGKWNPPKVSGFGSTAYVLWGESSHPQNRLYLHRYQSGGWARTSITGWIEYSDLVMDADGDVHVVYFDIQGQSGLFHWAFRNLQPVVSYRLMYDGSYKHPDLVRGHGGQVLMAARFQHLYRASMSASFQWSALEFYGDIGGQSAGNPSIALHPQGGSELAWTAWNNHGGWWPEAVHWKAPPAGSMRLSTDPMGADATEEGGDNAELAIDVAGNRLVVWSDNTRQGRLHYAYYSVAEGSWSPDLQVNPSSWGELRPQVVSIGNGHFQLVWETDGGEIRSCKAQGSSTPPTPTPSPTPTPAVEPGFILAGYWNTTHVTPQGGMATLLCATHGGGHGTVSEVELLLDGMPTGIHLTRSAEGLYALVWPGPDSPGDPGSRIRYGLRALDASGVELARWPELKAHP